MWNDVERFFIDRRGISLKSFVKDIRNPSVTFSDSSPLRGAF